MLSFLSNKEIYDKVICGLVPQAKKRLWIATADIKDMYVAMPGRSDMVPFLQVLDTLLARGVDIRLLHAKEPGPNFRQDFDRFPRLWKQMERVLCPRVHFKCIISDGAKAYFGSANLTGAGLALRLLAIHSNERPSCSVSVSGSAWNATSSTSAEASGESEYPETPGR